MLLKPTRCAHPRGWSGSFGGIIALSLLMAACAPVGCRSTHFPEHPTEHRLAKELAAAPHPYYKFLANGVFGRAVAVQPRAAAQQMLKDLKEKQWPEVEPLKSSAEIAAYLRAHDAAPLAQAIDDSQRALASQQPATLETELEATAVKQGFIEAYYGLFPPPGNR
jgi:hypothetical protein